MELDHLAVVSADLEAGVAHVEAALGVRLSTGGRHAMFGTWNRLLSLGPGLYLEAIAPDPAAPPPGRPRWFALDGAGAPRLGNWIARVPDLDAALAEAPEGAGDALDLERGELRWRISVPRDGSLPLGGAWPTLIEWQAGRHPSEALPDEGVRLRRLVVSGPGAAEAARRLAGRPAGPPVVFEPGPEPGFRAELDTPHGPRVLE